MSRPSRRAKQKQVHTEIVGLLPEEQAALTKALYASLHEQKSPDKNTSKQKEKQSPKLGKKRQNKSSTLGTKKSRLDQSSDSSSDSFSSDFTSPSLPWKQSECRSPSIYGHSHSSISSPFSTPSSPISFGSPGGSLRLVLSTTSWSDSFESPSRSSSIWSPGPSSPRLMPKIVTSKKKKKVLKGKNSRQDGFNSVGKGPKGKAGDRTPTVDEILLRVSQEYDKSSGKFSTPSKPKAHPASKNKSPKQTPENRLKSGSKTSKNVGKSHKTPPSKELKLYTKTTTPNGNKRKSEAVKDGIVNSKEEVSVESRSQNTSRDNCYNSQNDSEGSSHVSPCTYQAQRKFATNHTPLRQARDESEDLASLQEIPKTEDFITFLCLRGAPKIPHSLHKFKFPWTSYQKPPKIGRENGKVSKGHSVSKRLVFTPSSGQSIQNATARSVPQFPQAVS